MKYAMGLNTRNIRDKGIEENFHFNNFQNQSSCFDIDIKQAIGQIHFCEKKLSGLTLYEWECCFKHDCQVYCFTTEPALFMHFMLSGHTAYGKFNKWHQVKEGQNNICSFTRGYLGNALYPKAIRCSSLTIRFEKDFLKEGVNAYPDLLSELYRKHSRGENFCLQKTHLATSCEMNLILFQIRNAKHMGKISPLYTHAKILELLSLQLQQHHKRNTKSASKSELIKSDLDKIYEAKDLLLANINTPPSILELSRVTGLNDKKLQQGFKQLFNQTVYGCLFDHKMNLARQLLLETDKSIFEVALDCGYDYHSHFTSAFKRKYGLSPKQFKEEIGG